MHYVGIDLGGTNIKVGVVDNDANTLAHVKVPTHADRGPLQGVEAMCAAVEQAIADCSLSKSDVRGVGLATPGTMDIPAGILIRPHNLPGWFDIPIRQQVADRLDLPTILQNDASAAAYGEFWAGQAKEADSLVFWTLGTGIGCGIIVGDTIIEGAHSHGAECGHIIIEMDNGRLCASGQYGTLEAYASATALIARCQEGLEAGRESSISIRLAAGEELTPLLVAQEAEAGDPYADELVMQTARYMGVGTTTLLHTINPDMVLLGGAMTFGRDESALGRRFIEEIRREVRKRAFPVPAEKTRIEYASLGGDAGYIGAAGCARLKFS